MSASKRGAMMMGVILMTLATPCWSQSVGLTGSTLSCGRTTTGSTSGSRNTVGQSSAERWHPFVAPFTGTFTFNTCGSGYDTWVLIYRRTGTTTRATSPLYNCDDCGPCGTRTVATATLTSGTSYWIAIEGYRSSVGSYRIQVTCTSRAPTRAPTRVPTRVPTRRPTRAPTRLPTRLPTRMPTRVPTTRAPTADPTLAPTFHPCDTTRHGCLLPSTYCTNSGLSGNSQTSIHGPVLNPGQATAYACACNITMGFTVRTSPFACSTAAPTASPTSTPTATPTAAPSATPTAAPTATPSAVPTAAPTAVPTAVPSAAPTGAPVAAASSSGAAGGTVGGLPFWVIIVAVAALCLVIFMIVFAKRRKKQEDAVMPKGFTNPQYEAGDTTVNPSYSETVDPPPPADGYLMMDDKPDDGGLYGEVEDPPAVATDETYEELDQDHAVNPTLRQESAAIADETYEEVAEADDGVYEAPPELVKRSAAVDPAPAVVDDDIYEPPASTERPQSRAWDDDF